MTVEIGHHDATLGVRAGSHPKTSLPVASHEQMHTQTLGQTKTDRIYVKESTRMFRNYDWEKPACATRNAKLFEGRGMPTCQETKPNTYYNLVYGICMEAHGEFLVM